ncbi:MAG: YraN family protein [Paludibacteraceae bacterium]|nr:YraN family protein [Paludibacteraceae bacterium]
MAAHNELGRKGEELALKMLRDKGYTILEHNWRLNGLEIDIIATKGKVIAFVEVKTRSDDQWMYPEQAVDAKRKIRMSIAAKAYVRHNRIDLDVRYDIVAIVWNQTRCEIEHIEDAFLPPMRTYSSRGVRYYS